MPSQPACSVCTFFCGTAVNNISPTAILKIVKIPTILPSPLPTVANTGFHKKTYISESERCGAHFRFLIERRGSTFLRCASYQQLYIEHRRTEFSKTSKSRESNPPRKTPNIPGAEPEGDQAGPNTFTAMENGFRRLCSMCARRKVQWVIITICMNCIVALKIQQYPTKHKA